MISDERISNLIESIYDCAGESSPRAWRRVFKEMTDCLSSGPAAMTMYSPVKDHFDFIATTYSESTLNSYFQHFHHISPLHEAIVKLRPGEQFRRLRDLPDEKLIKTVFYRDFMKRQGIYDLIYSALFTRSGLTAGVSFSRPSKSSAFRRDDINLINTLIPHLGRALKSYMAVNELRMENMRMVETLSKIPRSILFVNRPAKVLFCNDAASKALSSRDGLEMDRSGRLFASLTKDERQLKSILESVFDPKRESSISFGGVLPISRPSGLRPLQVLISPFAEQLASGYESEPLALVVVYDPEQNIETVEELLRHMYGLTPAEARLAGLIAKGRSLGEAGILLGISHDTVRTHLKRIFSKTRTNRQSDLITLILNSPAALKNL